VVVPAVAPGAPVDARNVSRPSNGDKLLLLTPATSISVGKPDTVIPADTYTRLIITSYNASSDAEAAEDAQIYPYRKRSGIERFFVGLRRSVTLSAKVSSGGFVATIPLVTVTHESTRAGGEVFNRIIRHQAQDFPMFLVRGTTTSDIASVVFDLKGSDSVDSSAAGTALSAVVAATKVIAPQAALLTTFSAPGAKDVASSLDSTINKLFAMSLAEEHLLDQPIREWRPLTLELRLPRRESGWNDLTVARAPGDRDPISRKDLDYGLIGTWEVAFTDPRISAFATPTVKCKSLGCAAEMSAAKSAALTELKGRTADVLSFPLVAGSGPANTIGSYLRQLSWWADALKALDADPAEASHFCRSIHDALSLIGFNTFDAAIVTDGVRKSSMMSDKAVAAMGKAADCALPTA
jgi:hypothetical protein